MRHLLRIAAVLSGILVASAVVAAVLNQFLARFSFAAEIDGVAMFVGLATSGLMAAMLTRDSWLVVR